MNIIYEKESNLKYNFNFKNNIKLLPYQVSTIEKMLEFEEFNYKNLNHLSNFNKEKIYNEYNNRYYTTYIIPFNNSKFCSFEEEDFNYRKLNYNNFKNIKNNFIFQSNIGVLSNKVGTGKTIITLGLIMYKKLVKEYNLYKKQNNLIYDIFKMFPKDITNKISSYIKPNIRLQLMTKINQNYEINNLYVKDVFTKNKINTNLIIISHNLFNQWKSEINNLTYLKCLCITSKKDINNLKIDNLCNYDIILCNSNKLKDLYKLTYNYSWSRIFIDEADIINIPNFPRLESNFLWLITTTYKRLLKPKNNGYIKDIFYSSYKTGINNILDSITIQCDENYINKYKTHFEPTVDKYILKTPLLNKFLYLLNNKYINNDINLSNFTNIYYYFSKKNYCFFIDKYKNFLRNYFNYKPNVINIITMEIIIYLKNELNYFIDCGKHKKKKYYKYYKYYKILKLIINTYQNNNICFYCNKKNNLYIKEDLCCNDCNISLYYLCITEKIFKLTDLDKYKKQIINIGLQIFKINNIFFDNVSDDKLKSIDNYIKNDISIEDIEFNYNNKINKLTDLLNEDIQNGKKSLVFANDYFIFDKLQDLFDIKKYKYRVLKGNHNIIKNIIKKYSNNEINILLLNTKYSGSGLNLQMSDNIYILNKLDDSTELQVVGRVNRYGKNNNFKVKYILYEEEEK